VRVLELSLRNYRVFEEVDLELPSKVIGVFGENGSGKTTLMESIGFACFGVDAARTKKHEIRTEGLLTECQVRMVFEHAGRQHEVRRVLRGKGSAPEAELYAGGLLLASGAADVDAEMRRLLHMDLHVFRASVFAEQKQLDAMSSMRPGERKEMALRLLGIKPVDDARSAARGEARAVKQSVEQLTGAIVDVAELEALLKEAGDVALEAERRLEASTAEVREAEGSQQEARKAFEALDAGKQRAEKLLVAIQAATEERARVASRLDDLTARIDELTERLDELPALMKQLQELSGAPDRLRAAERITELAGQRAGLLEQLEAQLVVDMDAAASELKAAQQRERDAERAAAKGRARSEQAASRLDEAQERLDRAAEADPTQPCPTCGRPLGQDFAGYLRHCRQEVTAAKGETVAARKASTAAEASLGAEESARRDAEAAWERARDAHARRAEVSVAVEKITAELDGLETSFGTLATDLDSVRAEVREAHGLAGRVSELKGESRHLEPLRRDLAAARERLEELDGQLEGLTEEAEQLAFDPDEHEAARVALRYAEARVDRSRDRERAAAEELSRAREEAGRLDGELKQARETVARVDDLRSEGRHVERVAMLLDGFRDHLVARVGPELSREAEAVFRDLTTHDYDDLRIDEETLNIEIADGNSYHPIERFSGSETDLANLALRVAISTHLSRVSGADVGLMVLDEVLGSLDEERKDLMVQTLGRLTGRFHQLFVITHAERVKDQFPAVIQVRKTARRRSEALLV
jgi:DNA repair protein SbcC/Rad50